MVQGSYFYHRFLVMKTLSIHQQKQILRKVKEIVMNDLKQFILININFFLPLKINGRLIANKNTYIILKKRKTQKMQVHFYITLHLKYGDALYLIGNTPDMGSWNPQKAIRMIWTQNDVWTTLVEAKSFQYKYFIGDYNTGELLFWEQGPNRNYNPSQEDTQVVKDSFNHRKIIIQVKNNHNQKIYISGSCRQLGDFQYEILMRNKQHQSFIKLMINVFEDIEIYFCLFYHKKCKKIPSDLYTVNIKNQINNHLSTVIYNVTDFIEDRRIIRQLDNQIYFGYVPNSFEELKKLKGEGIHTVVEFRSHYENTMHEETIDNLNYYVFQINERDKKITDLLFFTIQLLIIKFQKIYICNNSLRHIKQYLNTFQSLLQKYTKQSMI
ncbi:hypothetical protein pb186bvf_002488 [Paramecium bursaria]